MSRELDFVNEEIVSLLFHRVPDADPKGLLDNLKQDFSDKKGWGYIIHGPEEAFKSEVARFLLRWARDYVNAEECEFIDVVQDNIETPQQLYAQIDKASSQNALRMLIIDHIDMLKFVPTHNDANYSGPTDTRPMQSLVRDGLVIVACSRKSPEDIDQGDTNQDIRQFTRFQPTANGWVSPVEAERLLEAFLRDHPDRDRVCRFAERYSYNWKALYLIALDDEPGAVKVLERGIVSLIDWLKLTDNQQVLSSQDEDNLRRRGIWKLSEAPPPALMEAFEKELQRRANLRSVFWEEFPLPAEHCGVDDKELGHDWASFSKLDNQAGAERLIRLQRHVKFHQDNCDDCKNVLNSLEVGPLVGELLRASWMVIGVERLELVAWLIKYWVRGLRGDKVPALFFQTVVEQCSSNEYQPAPPALERVPVEDDDLYRDVIAPLYHVVRAVLRLRDGTNLPQFAQQKLKIGMLDQNGSGNRRFAVELHDGPCVPVRGMKTTIRTLEALCDWAGQDQSRYFCFTQEYENGKRTIRLEFKTVVGGLSIDTTSDNFKTNLGKPIDSSQVGT